MPDRSSPSVNNQGYLAAFTWLPTRDIRRLVPVDRPITSTPNYPQVEEYVLDLLARRTFRKADFTESADGEVRLLAPVTHELAGSMPTWAKALAPTTEACAHLIGQSLAGQFHTRTPLTGANQRAAQIQVKARKAKAEVAAKRAKNQPAVRQQPPAQPLLPLVSTCVQCGGPLNRDRHKRCPVCWAAQPGQGVEVRQRRGKAIAASRGELERWKTEHPEAAPDPETFATAILLGLAGVKPAEIMTACGVAKSTASMIRTGRYVPAFAAGERIECPICHVHAFVLSNKEQRTPIQRNATRQSPWRARTERSARISRSSRRKT